MSQLIVTHEQAKLIAQSPMGVEIVDAEGHFVGYAAPSFSEQELVEAEQALALREPRYTTQEVLDYLKSLDGK